MTTNWMCSRLCSTTQFSGLFSLLKWVWLTSCFSSVKPRLGTQYLAWPNSLWSNTLSAGCWHSCLFLWPSSLRRLYLSSHSNPYLLNWISSLRCQDKAILQACMKRPKTSLWRRMSNNALLTIWWNYQPKRNQLCTLLTLRWMYRAITNMSSSLI